jgi:hypothetical protein
MVTCIEEYDISYLPALVGCDPQNLTFLEVKGLGRTAGDDEFLKEFARIPHFLNHFCPLQG